MLSTLITKELKSILLSPKFPATFGACSVLILLSIFVGLREYKASVAETASARALVDQEQREATSWTGVGNTVFRDPDPMQVFVAGLQNDIGRLSDVSSFAGIRLTHSIYSDDPIFAVFRFIDFAFIVQVVLSLFAILFTYDAINGERESGTLALTLSTAVPRAKYIAGKLTGAWLGLVLPITIPVLLGVLLVITAGVPFDGAHWVRLGWLMGASLLYFTFFIVLGVLISSFTGTSSVSFLFSLVSWIALVLIIPRAGIMAAGQLVPAPTDAELDGQVAAYAKGRWAQHNEQMEQRWIERSKATAGMNNEDREAYQEQHQWGWLEEDEAARKEVQMDIDRQTAKFQEDMRNRKQAQVRLGLGLSRISPASAFQLAAMQLAGTDIDMKTRCENAMQVYRQSFLAYRDKKQQEAGGFGGIRITMDSQRGFSFQAPRDNAALNLSDMPRFKAPEIALPDYITPALIDIGLLTVFSIIAFAGAFVGFLRYDVR